MSKNLHKKPFDDTTIAKLEIFEDYAKAWLPTFVMWGESVVCIFDFFAGTGYDIKDNPGSPIRLLRIIQGQADLIQAKNTRIRIFLNEFDKSKFNLLCTACHEFIRLHPEIQQHVTIEYANEDFDKIFFEWLPFIQQYSSLVYLDQNGVRFLSDRYLLELEKTTRTDFLYFASSSYFRRFGDSEEFKRHLEVDMVEINKKPYKLIHRTLIEQLRKKLPVATKLKLYPFALKKGANIHGIIFGATHPRAVDKFIGIAWNKNETNGEANFDLDDDELKSQLLLFDEKQLTKIESFQNRLREFILSEKIKNNIDAFNFALEEGHLGSHAAEVLKKMKEEGLVNFEGRSPLVNYDSVYKNQRELAFKVLKK